MQPDVVGLEIKAIFRYISIACDTIGVKWLSRKVEEEKRRRKEDKRGFINRKHSDFYRISPHPLVQWEIETQHWREACLKSGKMELSQAVLKFALLGKALEQTRHCRGFDRIKSRLKIGKEFYATAFEAEVAASYIARNWDAEFVEEHTKRSPDLKITRGDGTFFWAECKCRDTLTERDKNIESFWKELESSLLRVLGPKKLNYGILVKALQDPTFAQMPALRNYIFEVINKGGVGEFDMRSSKIESVSDPTGHFLLSVTKLSAPDEELKASSLEIQSSDNFDRITMFFEMKRDKVGGGYFRNPIIIFLLNVKPPDRITGIIHAFKSAADQLPEEGPGVIWIRVPHNSWSDKTDQSLKQAENLLRAELTGSHNQRVNAVVLMTRLFRRIEKDGQKGLSYKPQTLTLEHRNPRKPMKA